MPLVLFIHFSSFFHIRPLRISRLSKLLFVCISLLKNTRKLIQQKRCWRFPRPKTFCLAAWRKIYFSFYLFQVCSISIFFRCVFSNVYDESWHRHINNKQSRLWFLHISSVAKDSKQTDATLTENLVSGPAQQNKTQSGCLATDISLWPSSSSRCC